MRIYFTIFYERKFSALVSAVFGKFGIVEISHVINSFIRGMKEKTEDFDKKKLHQKKKKKF